MSDDVPWKPTIEFVEPSPAKQAKMRRARLNAEQRRRTELDAALVAKSRRLAARELRIEREAERLRNRAVDRGHVACEHPDDVVAAVGDGTAHWCRECGAIQLRPAGPWKTPRRAQ